MGLVARGNHLLEGGVFLDETVQLLRALRGAAGETKTEQCANDAR